MLICEVGKKAHLTKKAVEYYTEQQLIHPAVLENGYRDFSLFDVECLKKIAVLRKLGLGIREIKAVLADETGGALQKISVQKELTERKEAALKVIFNRLCRGEAYADINAALEAVYRSATVAERLLTAFPGYYSRFVCLHFARFLNEPIETEEQHQAYNEIMDFLDNAPALAFPEDLQAFLDECTGVYTTDNINDMLENTRQSVENPDEYLLKNKEAYEQYLAFRLSDEYKNSPLSRLREVLITFNNASGYYDIFIPAMKKLSKSYTAYCRQMETAREKMLIQFPDIIQITE